MRTYKLTASAILLALCTILNINAQTGTQTPYSRFGYGILSDNATSTQRAMGGVGYAMHSGRQINVMNPASYARIDSLTFLFDMGFDMSKIWSKQVGANPVSEQDFTGGLDYITMQFPITKWLGMSVGLLPFSEVGYSFSNTIDNGYTARSGTGSYSQLYAGVGARVYEGLTIGVNMSYLFGSVTYDTYSVLTGSSSTSLFEREISIRDWHLTAGVQYVMPFGKDELAIGLTFSPGKDLMGRNKLYAMDTDHETSNSLIESIKLQDNYSLPSTYGAGVSYTWRQRLMAEVDVTYQPWASAKYEGSENYFADRYKIAAGLQYQPTLRGGYFKRVQYRLGGYYNRDYLVVRGNNVKEYGVTAGFGFPVPGFKTVVNLGFEYVHRQASPSALIKENYINITIGVNFNEMWFRKSKIY